MPTKKVELDLTNIGEGEVRENFERLQEYHDDKAVGSIYDNGYAIYTERFLVPANTTVKKTAPGDIVMISGMTQLDPASNGWIPFNYYNDFPVMGFTGPGNPSEAVYAVFNNYSVDRQVKIFAIYKRV